MTISVEKKPCILIVDDVPVNIQVLAQGIKDKYHVKIATSGHKALEIAGMDTQPDLILLDIMMPDLDGYEVCRRLKESALSRNIPIIFITAKDEAEDETRGLALGAVDYITKPFHLPVVLARVETHLRLKQKSDLLESLISIDNLTDIPNRRAFDEAYAQEWKRGCRAGTELSLLFMDIDQFKQYNDRYGHAMGDHCLRQVAQALAGTPRRPADKVARYGGEEFVAILPETGLESAIDMAHRCLRKVSDLHIPHEASDVTDHVTLSIGVASIRPGKNSSAENLILSADQMLYKAKDAGRNCVVAVDEKKPARPAS